MISWLLALAVAAGTPPQRGRADAGVKAEPTPLKPIQIVSDRLHIQGKKQLAIWTGNVKTVRGTTHLSCNRMITYYTRTQEISRVQCNGNVEVIDGDKWARGEQADFDNVTGILVVIGDPEAKQGANHVRGTKVTFHVDQDTVEVENAKAVVETTPQGTPAVPKPEPKKEKSSP